MLTRAGQLTLKITLARAHIQIGAANAHFDGVVILRAVGFSRRKRDGVLIPRLLGNFRVKPFQIILFRSVERVPTCCGGILVNLSRPVLDYRAANRRLVRNGNSVYGNVAEKQRVQRFVKRMLVVVRIAAVRNQENYLSPVAPSSL